MLFIALLAIILPLLFIVVLRQSVRRSMTISALIVGASAWWAWGMQPIAIWASLWQALHRSLTIGLILYGAITLVKTLQTTGAFSRIKQGFYAISPDMRVQTVLVAFAFVSLIEGASGFGTPAIVAAPLLIILGFTPLAAATLALLGDTVAVTFGAVGTPLLVGLENVPHYSPHLATLVGIQATMFDVIIGTLLPVGLIAVLVFGFGTQTARTKWHSLLAITPWALTMGLVYSLSAFVAVRLVGPEFTSIAAGALTLAIGMITAKRRIGIPAATWRHNTQESQPQLDHQLPLWKAWFPYGIVIGLLLLTRTIPAIKHTAHSLLDASWQTIWGVEGISSSWPILYSPGLILLIAAFGAAFIITRSARPLATPLKEALSATVKALLALVPTLILVQLFSNSGHNTSGLAAMPVFIGHTLAELFHGAWLAVAPLLGALGAFIAGSATVSTLTLGPVQASIADTAGLPLISVLALHMIGAAAGNIIAIHNVVAASTVVGLHGREGQIIRRLIVPTLVYLAIASLIGLVWYWLQ